MDEPGFLPDTKIAILGLGLMGGSLALALSGRCKALIGFDPDPDTRRLAAGMSVVDHLAESPSEALASADMVILAAPVRVILHQLAELKDLTARSLVVLDLGSTKAEIVQAMQELPERFDPIGGHPMCGKEKSSLAAAEPHIYRGATFALTPLVRTSAHASTLAQELTEAVGARSLWLDAETHDCWVSATSHLPYVLSNALSAVTPESAVPLIGPGFLSTSRVGATSAQVMADALLTNKTNVLEVMQRYRSRLEQLEQAVRDGDADRLHELLDEGAAARQRLMENPGRDNH